MKSFLFLFTFLQIPIIVFCQSFKISGKICDSESGQGLPYANVMVVGHSVGVTSDKNGIYNLSLSDSLQNEYLIFSYVGYVPSKLKIQNLGTKPVLLIQDQYVIGEVIIKPSKKSNKPLIINDFKEKNSELRYSKSPFDSIGELHIPYRPNEPTIEAIYFPYNSAFGDRTRIKEVKLSVANMGMPYSIFRLRLFDVKNDMRPDKDLIRDPINIKVLENDHSIRVNLEEYNLRITRSGLFIGFELLIIPENMQKISNNSGKTANMYSPFLKLLKTNTIGDYWIYSKGEWSLSKYWYYKRGIWFMSDKKNIATDRATYGPIMFRPAISLMLTD
jgi:hypothetical protein